MKRDSPEEILGVIRWKEQLEEELKGMRSECDQLEQAILRKETQLKHLNELLVLEGRAPESASGSGSTVRRSFTDAAYEIVSKLGQPLHYRELAERLAGAGVAIPGREPHSNLLAHLVRDERFQRIARGTYGLAEWRLKVAGMKKSSRSGKSNGRHKTLK